MSTMTNLLVRVNRAESIRRGINGTDTPVSIEIDVASLSQEDRDDVARCIRHLSDGRAYLASRSVSGGYYSEPMEVSDPSQAGLVEALSQFREAFAAEAAKKTAKEMQEKAERDAVTAALASVDTSGLKVSHFCPRYLHIELAGVPTAYHIEAHEIAATVARLRAAKAEQTEALAAKRAARESWIAAYGSPRLRTLLAEGIAHDDTYQSERAAYEQARFDERLAIGRPGWVEVEASEIDRRVADCTDSELAILRAARTMAPTCVLVEYDDEIVACEEFHGRLIVWPH